MKEDYGIHSVPDLILTFDNGEVFTFDTLCNAEFYFSHNYINIFFEDALLKENIRECILNNNLQSVRCIDYLRQRSDGSDVEKFWNHSGEWKISLKYQQTSSGDPAKMGYSLILTK